MQYSNLIFIVMLVAVFYFLVIRPQQQRAKQQKAMQDSLGVGDEIVTIGGVYGTIVDIGERIRVRVLDGSELEFARPAVSQKVAAKADDGAMVADDEGAAAKADDSGE